MRLRMENLGTHGVNVGIERRGYSTRFRALRPPSNIPRQPLVIRSYHSTRCALLNCTVRPDPFASPDTLHYFSPLREAAKAHQAMQSSWH